MQELRLGGKIASVDVVIDAPLRLFQEYTKDEEEEEKKEWEKVFVLKQRGTHTDQVCGILSVNRR